VGRSGFPFEIERPRADIGRGKRKGGNGSNLSAMGAHPAAGQERREQI